MLPATVTLGVVLRAPGSDACRNSTKSGPAASVASAADPPTRSSRSRGSNARQSWPAGRDTTTWLWSTVTVRVGPHVPTPHTGTVADPTCARNPFGGAVEASVLYANHSTVAASA